MKRILLCTLLFLANWHLWSQDHSFSFNCAGCDMPDLENALKDGGFLDLSDVADITLSDQSYTNLTQVGGQKKVTLSLNLDEAGIETAPYELTDVLEEAVGEFVNGGEGTASVTIHYITPMLCESGLQTIEAESMPSSDADYSEDVYILDPGDGGRPKIYTRFQFSASFESAFQGGGTMSRSAGPIGSGTKKLLFNAFKKVVAHVSSKNPWSIAINVVASYSIGGLVEYWIGDYTDITEYPTAFYQNMLKEGFTGFVANLVDAYGDGLTASLITSTISAIIRATNAEEFKPADILLEIAVGTVLNLLTTNGNIERLQGLIGNVRIFAGDLVSELSLFGVFFKDKRLVNAWKDLFDFPNLRTNTGALDAITKHRAGEVVPLPSTYLDAGYISNHLAKFDNGGSYLVPTEVLDQFGRNLVGRPDGQFIAPAGEIDDLLAAANGNISVIEDALGIPSGAWQGKQLSRIDIPNTSSHNRRLPSGNEAGANENWIPGGVTSGGKSEAVVDQIPIGSYTETIIN